MKKIKLTYFKPSGKYYCDGEYFSGLEYDFLIYGEVRKWANGDMNQSLPGLSSTRWSGMILVDIEDGVRGIVCTGESDR